MTDENKLRKRRAVRIVVYLKRAYPKPKSELTYKTPFQLVVSVILSAQCTDKVVKKIEREFGGKIPRTADELQSLPGVGYKTAHVILGELYDIWEGIPTDTHVKRFAYRFDLSSHTDLKKISHDLEALVPKKDWKYVNNGLVLYGRYVCPARPHDCSQHPLTKLWPAAAKRWRKA